MRVSMSQLFCDYRIILTITIIIIVKFVNVVNHHLILSLIYVTDLT